MTILSLCLATVLITNVADLASNCREYRLGERFDITVTAIDVYSRLNPSWIAEDTSGRFSLYRIADEGEVFPTPGNRLRVTGIIRKSGYSKGGGVAFCQKITTLGKGTPPCPDAILTDSPPSPQNDLQLVLLSGKVQDAYRDEIDPTWYFVIVDCNGHLVNATFPSESDLSERLKKLPDAYVQLTGIYLNEPSGTRRMSGPHVALESVDAITVLKAVSPDPFDRPEIEASTSLSPAEISQLGRRRVHGRVLAAWHGNRILVRTDAGNLCGATLADASAPAFGDRIDVVGFAETDLYRINLSRAIWRPSGEPVRSLDPATNITVSAILGNRSNHTPVNPNLHGRTICLEGTVKSVPASDSEDPVIRIETDGMDVPVDFGKLSAGKTLSVGCRIRVTGVCILDIDNWQPHDAFPSIKGLVLVPRVASDLVVLSRPSWWTPGRLLAVIGVLLSALVVILVWNRILNRIIERRSHQLLRERSKRDNANLKNEERMRLAVELHDTISQNLAGIALQVDSAQLAVESEPASVPAFLESIRLRLLHCRKDLRNCLWDLRSRAFEEPTLSDAIRMTLTPHLNGTRLEVVGDVPSRELSDNVIHSVLCIIRELSVNAIRHGRAKNICVACRLNGERLAISVSDDGCGFDPEQRPNISTGHFGIQGVIERIERMEGSYVIESSPGHGTTFSINNLKTDL